MRSENRQSPKAYWQSMQKALVDWQQSGMEDRARLKDAIDILELWLNEYPAHAHDIQRQVLSICYAASQRYLNEEIQRLGAIGLDAALIRPLQTEEDKVSAALLSLLSADAHLNLTTVVAGQKLLDYAELLIRSIKPTGSLRAYLRLHLNTLRGSFAEAALQREAAALVFNEAIQLGEPLLKLKNVFRELGVRWLSLVFGNGPELIDRGEEQGLELLKFDIVRTFSRAVLGFSRTTDQGEEEAARKAVEVCMSYGLPADRPTLDLRRAITCLPLDELDSAIERLLALTTKLKNKKRAADWKAMLKSTQGLRWLNTSSAVSAKAFRETGKELKKTNDAVTAAICTGDLVMAQLTATSDMRLVKTFLHSFQLAAEGLTNTPLYLPFRAHFDIPIARIVQWAFQACVADPSTANLATLSVLVDALRSPKTQLPPELPEPGTVNEGMVHALNRIQRLSLALVNKRRTIAIILQLVEDDTLFVCATGNSDDALLLEQSGPDFQVATRELAIEFRRQIEDPASADHERLTVLGKAAFNALPERIQKLIKLHETVLFVPDFNFDLNGVPFELFQDGDEFLGLSKVVARFLSLRELLQAVEGSTLNQRRERRAVCVAAPRIKDLPELIYAGDEITAIQTLLNDEGWDVPEVEEQELDSNLLLESSELANLLHISAHGTAYAGGEALLLPGGRKLLVKDIENHPKSLRSFVFLNTCSLGQSRYLGGGVSKGIAYALVNAHAPCVIANLTPVYDSSATLLSAAFYERPKDESVGEALRQARRRLVEEGLPDAQWASTIMIGDPLHSFDASPVEESRNDLVNRLLNTFISLEASDDERNGLWHLAMETILKEPDHERLQAALLWIMNASEINTAEIDIEKTESLAELAHELSFPEGEAHFRLMMASAAVDDDPAHQLTLLDAAIRAIEPISSTSDLWNEALRECLANRQRLSIPKEPETFLYPLSINDQSDPAVRALFTIQHSLDQEEIQRSGRVDVTRFEDSIEDLAWNAIVIGQQNRFSHEFAQAEFAAQLAQKLTQMGLMKSDGEAGARRIITGLLPYLWSKQRTTHLDHNRARAQASAFKLVLQSIVDNWTPPEKSTAFPLVQPLPDKLMQAIKEEQQPGSSKYARALQALSNLESNGGGLSAFREELNRHITESGNKSPQAQADCAAWIIGWLLEVSSAFLTMNDAVRGVASQLMRIHDELLKSADTWFQYYLFEGYSIAPPERFNFLDEWRVGRVNEVSRTATENN